MQNGKMSVDRKFALSEEKVEVEKEDRHWQGLLYCY